MRDRHGPPVQKCGLEPSAAIFRAHPAAAAIAPVLCPQAPKTQDTRGRPCGLGPGVPSCNANIAG